MRNATDIAADTQRSTTFVRALTPPSPSRHAKLMLLKDGIVKLRQKELHSGSFRELLATVDVAVGTDTIACFLADVNTEAITTAINETIQPPTRGHSDPEPPTNRDRSRNHDNVIIFTNAGASGARRHALDHTRTCDPRVTDLRNLGVNAPLYEQTNQPRHQR